MQNAKTNYAKSSKPIVNVLSGLFTTTIIIVGGITVYSFRYFSKTKVESNLVSIAPETKTVTALGRLEPRGEVIQVSVSSSIAGNRVEKLLVKEGDRVNKGQIIAVLDNRDRLQAALKQAQENVRLAQANLAQVKAGTKIGEIEAQKAAIARIEAELKNNIAAQKATVARSEAELKNAQLEYQRYQKLYVERAISTSQRDSKLLTKETAQLKLEEAKANLTKISKATREQLQEAKATLEFIAEIRPVDIEVSAAEVREAQAALATARAELDLAYVKAPQTAQILKILTRPGEVISEDGIVRMGQTSQMYAVAEIYESDIGKVKVGQQVNLTSNTVSGKFYGTVEKIGLEVQRQDVINTDAAANIDSKIFEVKILLDEESSQKVSMLTNLSVKVTILM